MHQVKSPVIWEEKETPKPPGYFGGFCGMSYSSCKNSPFICLFLWSKTWMCIFMGDRCRNKFLKRWKYKISWLDFQNWSAWCVFFCFFCPSVVNVYFWALMHCGKKGRTHWEIQTILQILSGWSWIAHPDTAENAGISPQDVWLSWGIFHHNILFFDGVQAIRNCSVFCKQLHFLFHAFVLQYF